MNDYEMVILQRQRQREMIREREAITLAESVQKATRKAADPCAPTLWHQVKRWLRISVPKSAHPLPVNHPCPDVST